MVMALRNRMGAAYIKRDRMRDFWEIGIIYFSGPRLVPEC